MKLEEKGGLFSKFLQPKHSNDKTNFEVILEDSGVAPVKVEPFIQKPPPVKEDFENTWRDVPIVSSWEGKKRLKLQTNKTSTKARLLIHAPDEDETETCTIEIIKQVLESCHIVFGIDEEALQSFFVSSPNILYDTVVVIANGIPSIDGIDGSVKELFDRTNRPHFDERPDGSIDFKNMHIVNNVSKGTVICEIANPIQGVIGTNIYNKPIRPRIAKSPSIPRGENIDMVTIDENSSQLVAAIDGNLIFKDQRFCVENTFRVNGDVNNSVGNINFTGNVVVTGDVFEGYSVKTNGDVTIYGIVEGASIYAGGEIFLHKGVNGMGKGILEAQKGITAKFIENCTVRSGGDIKSESVINSTVESDGNITLVGRGTLVGGNITAFGSIDAKTIGSRSNTPIHIVLGVTPHMLRERNQLRSQHKAVLAEYQSLNSDVIFLEQSQQISEPERKKTLEQYRGKLNLVLFKKTRLEKKLQKLTEEQSNSTVCTLTCNTAYPPLRVTIGNESFRLANIGNMCRFYKNSNGEVVMGTK